MRNIIKETYKNFRAGIRGWIVYLLIFMAIDALCIAFPYGFVILIGAVLQTMVIYALLTQILKGSINFRPQPLDIAKFFVLRYLIIIVSTIVFSALILWSRLHDLDLMTAVSAILGIPLTVYLLARLNIALPLFVSGEKISVKNVWQKTHQKPGAWLLAGMAVYFPGVLSEIFLSPFLPYLASAVNGAFLIISVIFSTVFYNKKFKNN